jgi:uncharacterized protein (TIGR04222 family)
MKPFPFNLTGPEFLGFYALLSLVAWLLLRRLVAARELAIGGEAPRVTDPCEIAFLRGGKGEATFVALMSLEAQGSVVRDGATRLKAAEGVAAAGRNDLERVAFDYVRRGGGAMPKGVYADAAVVAAADALRRDLIGRGLLRDPWRLSGNPRLGPTLSVLALLWTVALYRIEVSGPPTGFLRTMLGLVTVVGIASLLITRTASGGAALRRLKLLFNVARRRIRKPAAGSVLGDAVLVTAVFGFAALPGFLRGQYPWWAAQHSSGCGSGGCGSSGCSGGGSGCGGGGCGGGCGG